MIPNPGLRAQVRQQAENRPGIYVMRGAKGEILYVGKSVRVKRRLLSYFRAEPEQKAGRIIRDARAIDWEYVPNEFAALVREMRLIKRWRPRHNVEHKRKRSFAFLKVTREPAPRVLPVTRVHPDGSTYFGPFARPHLLALTIRELTHVLGLRDCPSGIPIAFGDQLDIFRDRPVPRCIRAQTRNCLAPCCGHCHVSEYASQVELATRFLEGRSLEPLRLLRAEMERAALALDFEYAAVIRNRLERLGALQREVVAFRGRVEGLSLVYRVPGFRGDDRLYLIRKGLVEDEIPCPRGIAERRRAARRVDEVFGKAPANPVAMTPDVASEILLVARWFRLREGEAQRAVPPQEWLSTLETRWEPRDPAGG